jgi:hypothetical protein
VEINNCISGRKLTFGFIGRSDRTVKTIEFDCTVTLTVLQASLVTLGSFLKVITVSGSSPVTWKIAYQFIGSDLYNSTSNWYLPILVSKDPLLNVSTTTLQEGSITGLKQQNLHFNYPYSEVREQQSIWVDTANAATLSLTYGTNKFNVTQINSTSLANAISSICGSAVDSVTLFNSSSNSIWAEYIVTFSIGVVPPLTIEVNSSPSGSAFLAILTSADNVMKSFFDNGNSSEPNNFGSNPKIKSGYYNCYKRESNYTKWQYATGNTNAGVIAEVSLFFSLIFILQ